MRGEMGNTPPYTENKTMSEIERLIQTCGPGRWPPAQFSFRTPGVPASPGRREELNLPPLAANFGVQVRNPPCPALTVRGIGLGPRGLPAIAVFQHRARGSRQLRHPEMRFEITFVAREATDLLPFCWRSDYDELEEHSVIREGLEPNGQPVIRVDLHRLEDQRSVARDWDRLLLAQGFMQAYYRAWLVPPPSRVACA